MCAETRLREIVVMKRVRDNQQGACSVHTGQKVGGIVVEERSNWATNGWSLWTSGYCVGYFDVVDASIVVVVVGGHIGGAFRESTQCNPWESLKVLHRTGTRR
jgi:hypothetical protein